MFGMCDAHAVAENSQSKHATLCRSNDPHITKPSDSASLGISALTDAVESHDPFYGSCRVSDSLKTVRRNAFSPKI